ncbi:MAG: hypothetical protein V3V99_09460 [candidate division Zixibacteria bacterium]
MKKIFLLLMLLTLLPFKVGWCDFLGIKKVSEFISMPVHLALDSLYGIPRTPDSVHIVTFADNGNVTAYNARSTTAPFSDISIDTSNQYGQVKYWLVDQIQDIDGAGGHYTLGIQVSTFYNDIPTFSFGTVQIINDSLEQYLSAAEDSATNAAVNSLAVRDTAQYLITATDVNISQISGDATAANNLETMLDGTGGQVLSLGRLAVIGTNGASGSVTIDNNDGHGIVIEGNNGNAIYGYVQSGTNHASLYLQGYGAAPGLYARGGATGAGVQFIGGSTSGDAISTSVTTGNELDASLRVELVDDIWDEDTTGHKTEPNMGYWITQGGEVSISDADMTAISDSTWNKAFNTAFTAGTMGDSLNNKTYVQGAASGLDSATVQGAVIAAMNADTTLQLRTITVTGHNNEDAVTFTGSGTGIGLKVFGGTTGDAAYFRGGTTSGNGITAWTYDGHGIAIYGSKEKSGFYAEAQDSGAGMYLLGGDEANASELASGLRVKAPRDDAVWLSAGDQTNVHGIQVDGGTGNGGDAIRILGRGTDGHGISITSESGNNLDSETRSEIAQTFWGYDIDSAWVAGSFGDSAKTWSDKSPIGAGSYPVTLIAYDTANSMIVSNVRMSIFNVDLSSLSAVGLTGQQGSLQVNLNSGDYVVSCLAPGYMFNAYDTISISGSQTDSLMGYQFDPGAPASPDLCRVYGYFYSVDGQPIENVEVTAALVGNDIRKDNLIISPYKKSTTTNSNGYFYLDLIPSANMNPAGSQYMISASYPAGTILKKTIIVPDDDNWQINW